jgi:predicted dehydrogenase
MRLRYGLIGCGKVTERLALPQLARCPGAEVAALVDIKRTTALRLARRFHIDERRIWTDWRRMLRKAEVDVVAVNVPTDLHAEVTIAALEARKHVLVEKPMAMSLAQADAMINAARRHHRFLMVDQTQRFDPVHEAAYRLLRSHRLGRVREFRGRIGHAGPQYWAGTEKTWLVDRRRSGGGALMDIGIHIADLLRWFSGSAVARVFCGARMLRRRWHVEDNASVLMEFADGAFGSFEVSWTTRPYEVSTRAYGERGTLRTSIGAPHPIGVHPCRRRGDPNHPAGPARYPRVPPGSRLGGPYAYFTRCIAQGRAPFLSGEEGRASLEVILAAYASLRSGEWVRLPLRAGRPR